MLYCVASSIRFYAVPTYGAGPLDGSSFFSLGENGRLLAWKLGKSGWRANEAAMPETTSMMDAQVPQFCSAHSSRLVPHVIIVADRDR